MNRLIVGDTKDDGLFCESGEWKGVSMVGKQLFVLLSFVKYSERGRMQLGLKRP